MSLPSSEQWRPVPGYEGFYDVSDQGRVLSHPRNGTLGGILNPGIDMHGYIKIGLRRQGQRDYTQVHRLVMLAFVGPAPVGMEVRHLDGDSTNNKLTNLAYGTSAENKRDTLRHGNHRNAAKTHCRKGHPFDEVNTNLWRGTRYCRECKRLRDVQRRELLRNADVA